MGTSVMLGDYPVGDGPKGHHRVESMNDEKPKKRGLEPAMPRSSAPIANGGKISAESEPPSASIEQLPVRSAPMMQQNEMPNRRTRGRLSRHTLETLGRVLDVFYDDVRKEGVPDRFKELLRQFEERNDKGQN
jgi:hypothetical protein